MVAPVDLEIEVRGEHVRLMPERAMLWEARSTLLVADVHLGKEESFRRAGAPLPIGALTETLARLSSALDRTGAERLLVLGDLIHDARGLSERVIDEVAAWRAERSALDLWLVRGNHDRHAPDFPAAWSIRDAGAELREGPFLWIHEPRDQREGQGYPIAGHLHPTVELRAGADRMRLPCFHFGVKGGMLPAFTEFSNGPRVRSGRVFAVLPEAVHEVSARPR